MKTCGGKCGRTLFEDQFHWKIPGSVRQSRCKECVAEYHARYYEHHRDERAAQIQDRKKAKKEHHRALVAEWLDGRTCADCGTSENLFTLMPSGARPMNQLLKNGAATATVTAALEVAEAVCRGCTGKRTITRRRAEAVSS